MATSLPPEVLGAIARDLSRDISKRALVNFSLIARAFRTEGQRELFRSVDTGFVDGNAESRQAEIKMHRLFLTAIIAAPARLGASVRLYTSWYLAIAPASGDLHDEDTISDGDGDDTFNVHNPQQAALWNLTFKALPLMTHLKHLRFGAHRRGFEQTTQTCTAILHDCTFTLESLSWGRLLDLPALATDFLLRQPALQYLQIGTGTMGTPDDIDIPEVPSTALPLLQKISAPPHVLLALLPMRSVNAVSWSTPSVQPRGILRMEHHEAVNVAQSVSKLLLNTRYLALPDARVLTEMAQNLSTVQVLYLRAYNINEADTSIKFLVSLKIVILDVASSNMDDIFGELDVDIDEWEDSIKLIVDRMFLECPTLQQTYVQDPVNGWSYLTFIRNSQGEVEEMEEKSARKMMEHFRLWMPQELPHAHIISHYL